MSESRLTSRLTPPWAAANAEESAKSEGDPPPPGRLRDRERPWVGVPAEPVVFRREGFGRVLDDAGVGVVCEALEGWRRDDPAMECEFEFEFELEEVKVSCVDDWVYAESRVEESRPIIGFEMVRSRMLCDGFGREVERPLRPGNDEGGASAAEDAASRSRVTRG